MCTCKSPKKASLFWFSTTCVDSLSESKEKSVKSSFIEKILLAPNIKIKAANTRAIKKVLITRAIIPSPIS